MLLTRMRAGGVVISRARLLKAVTDDRSERVAATKKLRIVARPNRRAGQLRKD
jgi:hypothetical protein